ncbi:MAG: transcription termination/antitermination protein NusA, partial [Patescibacteria group bacterium]
DPAKFVANSLSPAKVLSVLLNQNEKRALVKVMPDQLSLAIGKRGQNVRLAARLTGWKIDIMEEGEGTAIKLASDEVLTDESAKTEDSLEDLTLPVEKLVVEETPIEEKIEEVVVEKPKKSASAKATADDGKKPKKIKKEKK